MNKQQYIEKIEESDLHQKIKDFLINKYESFNNDQRNWMIDNLKD